MMDFELAMKMNPQYFIAGISAALQAVQTWVALRDSSRAAAAFAAELKEAGAAPEIATEGAFLAALIPQEVYATMAQRTERCWSRYHRVLQNDREYLPEDIDNATEAVKNCICRELSRIADLNRGQIPPGKLREWWESYCV